MQQQVCLSIRGINCEEFNWLPYKLDWLCVSKLHLASSYCLKQKIQVFWTLIHKIIIWEYFKGNDYTFYSVFCVKTILVSAKFIYHGDCKDVSSLVILRLKTEIYGLKSLSQPLDWCEVRLKLRHKFVNDLRLYPNVQKMRFRLGQWTSICLPFLSLISKNSEKATHNKHFMFKSLLKWIVQVLVEKT